MKCTSTTRWSSARRHLAVYYVAWEQKGFHSVADALMSSQVSFKNLDHECQSHSVRIPRPMFIRPFGKAVGNPKRVDTSECTWRLSDSHLLQ